jgi:DNA replicative helicase MCM subunit Mcm2 (Cdc46/Mcm family)
LILFPRDPPGERYIRLARTFKPKISAEGQALLLKCYKKLREETTAVGQFQ